MSTTERTDAHPLGDDVNTIDRIVKRFPKLGFYIVVGSMFASGVAMCLYGWHLYDLDER